MSVAGAALLVGEPDAAVCITVQMPRTQGANAADKRTDSPWLNLPAATEEADTREQASLLLKTADDGCVNCILIQNADREETVYSDLVDAGRAISLHIPTGRYNFLAFSADRWYPVIDDFSDVDERAWMEGVDLQGGGLVYTIRIQNNVQSAEP